MLTHSLAPIIEKMSEIGTHVESLISTMGTLPLYMSVDIRESAHKVSVVDANLFPAGFNNISAVDLPLAADAFLSFVNSRGEKVSTVLLIAEEHTRNPYYIDHLFSLERIIRTAGFEVITATFLDPKIDSICKENHLVYLDSQSFGTFKMYCLHYILDEVDLGKRHLDLVVYNNDLSSGLPERLSKLKINAHPSPLAGWYARRKSRHFHFVNLIVNTLATTFNFDPWLLTPYFSYISDISINFETDRQRLAAEADILLSRIREKYTQYGIVDPPVLFLKADSGTYGMGVVSISAADEILNFNRKLRNNLSRGKGAHDIHHFILQEGVPTHLAVNSQIAESCLYLINNTIIGSFYRLNSEKSERDNLNSSGMSFSPISLSGIREKLGVNYGIYELISHISFAALAMEIHELKEPSNG